MNKAYSVFDVKAAAYDSPFFFSTDAVAVRSFQEVVNTKGTPFNMYPGDFTLYHVGDFNEATGEMVGVQPRILCTAASLVIVSNFEKLIDTASKGKEFPAEVK